ncbi:MAG: hypothetical protein V1860_03590 [bacterium]
MQHPNNFKNINKHLRIITECPLCKAKIIDLNVIEEANDSYLVHSKCKKCENSILFFAITSELGINVIGIATDLTIDEVIKLRRNEDFITSDDAIEMHKLIENGSFFREFCKVNQLGSCSVNQRQLIN